MQTGSHQTAHQVRTLLVAGPRQHLGAADIARKLRAACANRSPAVCRVVLDAHTEFEDAPHSGAAMQRAKMALYESIRRIGYALPSGVLLPTFGSQHFASELAKVSGVPVFHMVEALMHCIRELFPQGARVGLLASCAVRRLNLFDDLHVVYPREDLLAGLDESIEALHHSPVDRFDPLRFGTTAIDRACADLAGQGVDLILPASTLLGAISERLITWARGQGVMLIDANEVYAQHAAAAHAVPATKPFKIGVLGGVGPAATVSFLDLLVRRTPAARDQDHLKVVIEQNPQIPDRTEHLIGGGPDPTLELFATCKRLEAADASLIAIPCNTAHAFVRHLQPMLEIPIVHMLRETAQFIAVRYPRASIVGLLATTGTIASRVYHDEIEGAGCTTLITPDADGQRRVMEVIYGTAGVKAGFLTASNRDAVREAIRQLRLRGAEVVILGCTELPLLLPQDLDGDIDGMPVHVIDPAQVLADRCIALSQFGALSSQPSRICAFTQE